MVSLDIHAVFYAFFSQLKMKRFGICGCFKNKKMSVAGKQ